MEKFNKMKMNSMVCIESKKKMKQCITFSRYKRKEKAKQLKE